jgi:hypothetical protein
LEALEVTQVKEDRKSSSREDEQHTLSATEEEMECVFNFE